MLGSVPHIPLVNVSNSRVGGVLSAVRTGSVVVDVGQSLDHFGQEDFVDVSAGSVSDEAQLGLRWELGVHVVSRVVIPVHHALAFCNLVVFVVASKDDDRGVVSESLDDGLGLSLDIGVDLIIGGVLRGRQLGRPLLNYSPVHIQT